MRLERTARVIVGAVLGVVVGCGGTTGSGASGGNGGSRWTTADGGGAGGRGGAAGAHGDAGSDAGALCGSVRCTAEMVCCNPGCGICTPPGGVCVAGCPAVTACAETIDQYCASDASICPSGVARDWNAAKQQAPSLCLDARDNVYVEECGRYGILNGGGIDDDTVFYYDLATSQLVRVEHILMGPVLQCVAGIDIPDLNCAPDALPASLCSVSDAGVD